MSRFVLINRKQHANKSWRRLSSFRFAEGDAAVPLDLYEAITAARSMPIAFIEQQKRFKLVGVMGLRPGMNLMVTPEGRWAGNYIPAVLRTYPFGLMRGEGADQFFLAFDEEILQLRDGAVGDEPLFSPDGSLAPAVQQLFDTLLQTERFRAPTDAAVDALQHANVIEPWPIQVHFAEGPRTVTGLHRINEQALNQLDNEKFLELRKTAALPVAYTQLFSLPQFVVLEQLQKSRQQDASTLKMQNLPEFVLDDHSPEVVLDAASLARLKE